jgi:hypothetical protein
MIIKTHVQKVVQEQQFEPVQISCTLEKEINDSDYTREIKKLRHLAQKEVKTAMIEWLESD